VTIYFLQHAQDLHNAVKYKVIYMRQHVKIFSTMTKNLIVFFGVFVCIFDSMLRIFITPTQLNRELFICVCVTMILSLMTKICMVFFSVFVCFDGTVAETWRALIYRGPWMLWTT